MTNAALNQFADEHCSPGATTRAAGAAGSAGADGAGIDEAVEGSKQEL